MVISELDLGPDAALQDEQFCVEHVQEIPVEDAEVENTQQVKEKSEEEAENDVLQKGQRKNSERIGLDRTCNGAKRRRAMGDNPDDPEIAGQAMHRQEQRKDVYETLLQGVRKSMIQEMDLGQLEVSLAIDSITDWQGSPNLAVPEDLDEVELFRKVLSSWDDDDIERSKADLSYQFEEGETECLDLRTPETLVQAEPVCRHYSDEEQDGAERRSEDPLCRQNVNGGQSEATSIRIPDRQHDANGSTLDANAAAEDRASDTIGSEDIDKGDFSKKRQRVESLPKRTLRPEAESAAALQGGGGVAEHILKDTKQGDVPGSEQPEEAERTDSTTSLSKLEDDKDGAQPGRSKSPRPHNKEKTVEQSDIDIGHINKERSEVNPMHTTKLNIKRFFEQIEKAPHEHRPDEARRSQRKAAETS